MSRCIRKLENDNYWIIYCNTTDLLFTYLFASFEAAKLYLELREKYQITCVPNLMDSVVDIDDLNILKEELKKDG